MRIAIHLADDDVIVRIEPQTERERKLLELLDKKTFMAELKQPKLTEGQVAALSENYIALTSLRL